MDVGGLGRREPGKGRIDPVQRPLIMSADSVPSFARFKGDNMLRVQSAVGLLVLAFLAWLLSENRRRVPWRAVVGGGGRAIRRGRGDAQCVGGATGFFSAESGGPVFGRGHGSRHEPCFRISRRGTSSVRGRQSRGGLHFGLSGPTVGDRHERFVLPFVLLERHPGGGSGLSLVFAAHHGPGGGRRRSARAPISSSAWSKRRSWSGRTWRPCPAAAFSPS